MKRVMVIGNAGGGKTGLSRRLALAQGLPYFAVDDLMWRPGWERVPEEEFLDAQSRVLSQPCWLMDGVGSLASVERRLAVCDAVVFVDLPLWQHYFWATKRALLSAITGKDDAPEGCKMWPVTFRLYRMMWRVHQEMRPMLLRAMEASGAEVFRLTSAQEIKTFSL